MLRGGNHDFLTLQGGETMKEYFTPKQKEIITFIKLDLSIKSHFKKTRSQS